MPRIRRDGEVGGDSPVATPRRACFSPPQRGRLSRNRHDTTAPSGHRQFVPSDTAMRRFELPSET